MSETFIPVIAGVLAALAGIPVARWLEQTTYRKPDEIDEPSPGRRWWVPPTLGVVVGLLVHRIWLVEEPAVPGLWVAGVLTATLLVVALANVCLAAMDFDVHRLPDRVTGPVAALSLVALLLVSVVTRSPLMLLLGATGALLAGGGYFALHLIGGGALGLGDVKLAAIIGLTLGPLGLHVLWWALLFSPVLCLGSFIAARRRKPSNTRVAFGPWMLLGSLASVAIFGA